MSQLHGKQLRDESTSLEKLSGLGIVEFTNATMSFTADAVLTRTSPAEWETNDIVNKNYVDSVVQGLDIKESVKVKFDTSVTLSGVPGATQGVTLSAGDRVLLTGQSGGVDNGIWLISSGTWTRPVDFQAGTAADGNPIVTSGAFTFVEEGTFANSGFVLTTEDPIQVGTTPLAWSQFSGAGQITAGDGLTKTGNTLDVDLGTGLTFSGNEVVIANTTVSDGSYGQADSVTTFTVNEQGQLTAAGETTIDITSAQVNDFETAVSNEVFDSANFVDSDTVDFTVAGGSVSADVIINGTSSALQIDGNGLGVVVDGNSININSLGQLEVNSSAIVPDVSNGLSIDSVTEDIVLGGTLSQSTTISGDGGSNGLSLVNFSEFEVSATNSVGINSDESIIINAGVGVNTTAENITSNVDDFVITASSSFDVNVDNGVIMLDSGESGIVELYGGDITLFATGSVDIFSTQDVDIETVDFNLDFSGTGTVSVGGSQRGLVYSATPSNAGDLTLIHKQYVDDLVASATASTTYVAGDGLQLNGLTFSIRPSAAGTGLEFTGGVFNIVTSDFTGTLAGDGLGASGSALNILLDADALEFNVDNEVSLKSTIVGGRTFSNAVNFGDDITVANGVSVTNGGLTVVNGGADITGDVNIAGDFTVTGTVSYVNTQELEVFDNIITLAKGNTGSWVDAGIKVDRGTPGTEARLLWRENIDLWTAGLTGSEHAIALYAGGGLVKGSQSATFSLDYNIFGTGLTVSGTTVTVNTTQITSALAGAGLTSNGGALDIVAGTGIGVDTGVYIANTGVTASSYGSADSVSTFTVNAQGQLTAAGETTIDITSGQVNNFTASVDSIVFDSANFVNSGSIDFLVTTGNSVTAGVKLSGGTSSALGVTANGIFVLYDNDTIVLNNDGELTVDLGNLGAVDEVIAATGLSGGGSSSVVELEIDFDETAGILAGQGLNNNNGVLDINTGLGLEISGDDVAMVWGGTQTGLTFSGNAVEVNVDNDTIIINSSGELQVADISGLKSEPVYQLASPLSSGTSATGSATGITLSQTPSQYSRVQVFVNGLNVRVGNGTSSAFNAPVYFQNGTIRDINDLDNTCELFWNNDEAGYRLDPTDEIEIVYEA